MSTTTGPNSNAGAAQQGHADANAGRSPANTAGWDSAARQTYESTHKWQQEQNNKKSG
jgi:hypothetical protein